MTDTTDENSEYVWYAGYGSNLSQERFFCYILGKQFRFGGSKHKPCKDKTLPIENKPFEIPYSIYFAKESESWKNGGVAFISPYHESDDKKYTYGRIWKITKMQFLEIWEMEGKGWYNMKIDLGEESDGIHIYTITNQNIQKSNKPSNDYLKTIIDGLEETYEHLDKNVILEYLIDKDGIKGNFTKEKLSEIISWIRL